MLNACSGTVSNSVLSFTFKYLQVYCLKRTTATRRFLLNVFVYASYISIIFCKKTSNFIDPWGCNNALHEMELSHLHIESLLFCSNGYVKRDLYVQCICTIYVLLHKQYNLFSANTLFPTNSFVTHHSFEFAQMCRL